MLEHNIQHKYVSGTDQGNFQKGNCNPSLYLLCQEKKGEGEETNLIKDDQLR